MLKGIDLHAEMESLVLRARWFRWEKRKFGRTMKRAKKRDLLFFRLVKFRPTHEERTFAWPECVVGGAP